MGSSTGGMGSAGTYAPGYGNPYAQNSMGQQSYGQSMGQPSYGGMGGQYSPMRQQGPMPQGMPYGGPNPLSGAMGQPSGQMNQQQRALQMMRAGDVNGGISGVAGGVAGSQYQQPMRSGQSQPMGGPAPQAFANASPQASFMRGNDFATKQHDPYGGFTVPGAGPAQANPMTSSMSGMGGVTGGPSQVPNKMAQTSAIPGYNNPMPGANPGLTIDPRTMGFMQAWGGYGNYGQAANQYNQDYWTRFPGGQAPGGPVNYTPQNWDFNNGIG